MDSHQSADQTWTERPATTRAVVALAIVSVVVLMINLYRTKIAWIDEAQIADYFRTATQGETVSGQSFTLPGFPRLLLWLNVCQAPVLGIFGISMTSVRLLGIGWGLIFAWSLYTYLSCSGTKPGLAGIVTAAIILDRTVFLPMVVGRMDGAAWSATFFALYLFRKYSMRRNIRGAFVSGWVAAVAVDIWPAALLSLISLGMLEILDAWTRDREFFFRYLRVFVAGNLCCAAFTVLCLVGWIGWDAVYKNVVIPIPPVEESRFYYFCETFRANAKVLPSIWASILFAILALGQNRKCVVDCGIAATIALILNFATSTSCSGSRLSNCVIVFYVIMMRLLPFINSRWTWTVLLILALNFCYSIGLRYYRSYREWRGRDYDAFVSELADIPNGSSIYTHLWGIYYEGLRHHWLMYVGPETVDHFSIPVDYVIQDINHPQWSDLDRRQYKLEKSFDMLPGAEDRYNAQIYKRMKPN